MYDRFAAAGLEFKFADGGQPGEFEAYASVFDVVDFHESIIKPGAFTETLLKHAAKGTMPGMYAEHSAFQFGGDPLPIGVWKSMAEDSKGLHVKGKISALDSDHGKRIYGLMQDGAVTGFSIAFNVPAGGDVRGKKEGEPKRTINKIDLHAVDLVRDPANAQAQLLHLNSVMRNVDAQAAQEAVAQAMKMHKDHLSGQNSPTNDQRQQMLGHLMNAHRALTGRDMPQGMNSASKPNTIREFEQWLREEFQLSRSSAQVIAELGFKAPRDEAEQAAKEAARSDTLNELSSLVSGFTLISKKD